MITFWISDISINIHIYSLFFMFYSKYACYKNKWSIWWFPIKMFSRFDYNIIHYNLQVTIVYLIDLLHDSFYRFEIG